MYKTIIFSLFTHPFNTNRYSEWYINAYTYIRMYYIQMSPHPPYISALINLYLSCIYQIYSGIPSTKNAWVVVTFMISPALCLSLLLVYITTMYVCITSYPALFSASSTLHYSIPSLLQQLFLPLTALMSCSKLRYSIIIHFYYIICFCSLLLYFALHLIKSINVGMFNSSNRKVSPDIR